MENDNRQTLFNALINRILEGEGTAAAEDRKAAFDNLIVADGLNTLIKKVALHPTKITEENINQIISSGYSEDQIFELIICAAVGQASRQYKSGLEALTEAMNK
jgi:hypothetical protein